MQCFMIFNNIFTNWDSQFIINSLFHEKNNSRNIIICSDRKNWLPVKGQKENFLTIHNI